MENTANESGSGKSGIEPNSATPQKPISLFEGVDQRVPFLPGEMEGGVAFIIELPRSNPPGRDITLLVNAFSDFRHMNNAMLLLS
jgi:hypothetical protein